MPSLNNDRIAPYVFKRPIYVTKPQLPDLDQYMVALSDIWSVGQVTNSGHQLRHYESKITDYLNIPHACAVVNGHAALESALRALKLTGEVITTPFTFPSTIHAITLNGLQPVFCDIDAESYNIDPAKIEALITKDTSAILAVHVFGTPCNVEALQKIAGKHQIKLIYDAAHAFGTRINGNGIGQFGDMSIFSTHATKVFHTIEGGLVIHKDEKYARPLSQLRNFGYSEKSSDDDVECIGANYKMSELHAAIGLLNLNTIDEQICTRKGLFELFYSKLNKLEGIHIRTYCENVTPNYAYLPILVDPQASGVTRDDIYNNLSQHNVHARKYFYPLCTQLSCYQGFPFYQQTFHIAAKVSNNILCLPIYPALGHNEVNNICNIISSTISASVSHQK